MRLQIFYVLYDEHEKPLASSLCDQTAERLIKQHQNANGFFGKNLVVKNGKSEQHH